MNCQAIWRRREYIQNFITENKIQKEHFFEYIRIIAEEKKIYNEFIKENYDINFDDFFKNEIAQYIFSD